MADTRRPPYWIAKQRYGRTNVLIASIKPRQPLVNSDRITRSEVLNDLCPLASTQTAIRQINPRTIQYNGLHGMASTEKIWEWQKLLTQKKNKNSEKWSKGKKERKRTQDNNKRHTNGNLQGKESDKSGSPTILTVEVTRQIGTKWTRLLRIDSQTGIYGQPCKQPYPVIYSSLWVIWPGQTQILPLPTWAP